MEAQQTATVAGEYYLSGVMETASGFKLNDDSTFEFFLSYGALDRSATGTWKQEGDSIVFNSPKPARQSFILADHKQEDDEYFTISISDANSYLIQCVYAIIKTGDEQIEKNTDKNGYIRLPKQPVESIMLVLEFCPDRVAIFPINNTEENYFEFKFDPSIMHVIFDNVKLAITENGLSGQHPLLKPGNYQFRKH